MAKFEIRIKRSVAKELLRLPKTDNRRILARIRSLADDPRPPGAKKLVGHDSYRLRQGDYRILYTVFDTVLVIEVVRIGHRGDVYRE